MAKNIKNKDLLERIKKQAGRLDTPPPKVFRDKSKYTRKKKYRRTFINDDSHSGFFMSINRHSAGSIWCIDSIGSVPNSLLVKKKSSGFSIFF